MNINAADLMGSEAILMSMIFVAKIAKNIKLFGWINCLNWSLG